MTDFQNDIEECLKVIRDGGLILYPTDTVWGIGCDATNEKAVQEIYELKRRSESKSMIVLVAEDRDILKYTSNPDLQVFEFLKNAKKPTTVIYDGAIGLASNLIHEDGTIGIRIVQEIFCKNLIKRLRKPIVSTSANISGKTSPHFFTDISDEIKNNVDYVVKYRNDDLSIHQSSAIVKWNKDGTVTIIRN